MFRLNASHHAVITPSLKAAADKKSDGHLKRDSDKVFDPEISTYGNGVWSPVPLSVGPYLPPIPLYRVNIANFALFSEFLLFSLLFANANFEISLCCSILSGPCSMRAYRYAIGWKGAWRPSRTSQIMDSISCFLRIGNQKWINIFVEMCLTGRWTSERHDIIVYSDEHGCIG